MPPDLNRLARAAIQRLGPVQKHGQFTHPLSIQDDDGCRVVPDGTPRLQFFVEVRMGRMRQIFVLRSRVMFRPRAKSSRGQARAPQLVSPAAKDPTGSTAGDRSQSKRRSPPVPNTDPGRSRAKEFGR